MHVTLHTNLIQRDVSKEAHLFKEISVPLLSVNNLCADDPAIIFHGPNAAVFKPTQPTITLDGEPVLLGSLGKSTELYMVDVHGQNNTNLCKLCGGGHHQRNPN